MPRPQPPYGTKRTTGGRGAAVPSPLAQAGAGSAVPGAQRAAPGPARPRGLREPRGGAVPAAPAPPRPPLPGPPPREAERPAGQRVAPRGYITVTDGLWAGPGAAAKLPLRAGAWCERLARRPHSDSGPHRPYPPHQPPGTARGAGGGGPVPEPCPV